MDNLIAAVKVAAIDAIENSKPLSAFYGTVTKETPLTIKIDDFEYDKSFLVLTRNVTDHVVKLTQNGNVGNGESGATSYLVHNKLKQGDKVLAIREQGGQRYIIVDKVV